MKKGSGTCDALAAGRPIAILHMQGRYVPGEKAEQWRGEGHCERMPLIEIMDRLPHYTIASMVASKRLEKEKGENVDDLHLGVSEVGRSVHDRICLKAKEMVCLTHLWLFMLIFLLFDVQQRLAMENKSHTTEVMQKTRIELENGDITNAEMDEAIRVSAIFSGQSAFQR